MSNCPINDDEKIRATRGNFHTYCENNLKVRLQVPTKVPIARNNQHTMYVERSQHQLMARFTTLAFGTWFKTSKVVSLIWVKV